MARDEAAGRRKSDPNHPTTGRTTGQHRFVAAHLPHWDRVTWPEVLFAIAIIGAPLAIGSVHILAQIALATTLLAAFIGASWKLARERRDVRVGWIGLGLFIALGWSFLLWLPLPADLVAALSPASHEARLIAASLAQADPPTWMPLTLDAGRAAAGIVSLLAVTLAYLTATSLRHDSNARARITTYVELAALGVLASAIVHNALDLTAIWGLYTPTTTGLPAFATSFVNPNHAAALMLLGALVAFGASLAPDRSQRWHLLVGIALSIGVLVSMSRANALLLIAGLVILTVPPLFSRRFADHRGRLWRLLAGALCCLFVALVLIGPERWLNEFAAIEDQGLTGQGVFTYCWSVASDVLGVAPLTGIGPGNFGVASTPFVEAWHLGYLAYAHNGVQQVLADLGVVVGAIVLALVAAGFVRAVTVGLRRTPNCIRGQPDSVRPSANDLPLWGAGVALGMLALQNLVDFSLWIPGVAMPAVAIAGVAVEWSWPAAKARRRWLDPAWRWPLWACLIPLGVLIVTAVPAHRERPEAWKAAAASALASNPTTFDRGQLAQAHPHDYLAFDFAAALAAANDQRAEATRWLDRALALAPNDGPTLEAAARQALRDKDEARALTLIDRLDPDATGHARAITLVLDAPWAKALHEGFFQRSPARAIAASRELAARDQADRAEGLLVWSLARSPDSLALYFELGSRHWNDPSMLAKLATSCLATAGSPTNPTTAPAWERLGYLFQGRVEALAKRPLSAYQLYLASADAVPTEAATALLEAGKLAVQLAYPDWLDAVITRLQALPLEGAWQRGDYHLLRSHAAQLHDDNAIAIREMHEVLRHLGHVAAMHDRLADLYQRSGDPEAAARARARALALANPSTP